MGRVAMYIAGLILGVSLGYFLFTQSNYEKGFECGVIVTKMNVLTDTGTGEYTRLSDKYVLLGCEYDGREDIVSYIENM